MIDIKGLEFPEGVSFGLPESDYVRRGDAENAIRKACIMGHIPFSSATPEGQRALEAIRAVQHVEAADVAPVVHARWIRRTGTNDFECSACGESAGMPDGTVTPLQNGLRYCFGCGAKMDEEG